MRKSKIVLISVLSILGLGILLTVILVPLGIDYVNPGEKALLYNTGNKSVEKEHYESGRYYVGFSNKFIRFPSTIIELKFENEEAIESITKNYQTVNLEIYTELQFNVQIKTNLSDFYSRYGDNWIQIIKQNIIHNIIEVSANYNLIEFFERRADFKVDALNEISKSLNIATSNILVLKSLKFINIHFSENLEKAIEDKLIEKQNSRAMQIEGQINMVNKKTEGLIRIAEKEISSINLNQLSNFEVSKLIAHSQCLESIIKADSDSYKGINTDLGLDSDYNLLNFIYAFERKKFTGTQIINFSSLSLDKK